MTVSSIKHVPIIWRFHGNDSFFFAHYGLKLITIRLKYIIISTGFNSCINAIMQGRNRQVYLYSIGFINTLAMYLVALLKMADILVHKL